MKKLFNGKFLFILATSLVVLILLVIGAFYLFDDEDDVFAKSGYVLNPLSSTTEKYFFDENTGYKQNLSSMIEFSDVDENTVSILKDSFLHYLDDSLSFMKRGAILDLNSVNGSKAVSFYNITNKSIIEKKDDNYVIASASGDVVLKNFVGRISDNKYIVVGDLSLKIPGNDTTIKGDYFEIVYVEEGIVNVENQEVKYQVAAEGTIIYVGNDKTIDLGDKKITVNDEDLISITAITIDGDENIEIVPKAPEEDDSSNSDTGNGADAGTGNGTGAGNAPGVGEGGNNDETGDANTNVPQEDDVVIKIVNESIGSADIDVVFEILNAKDGDLFNLQVVNLGSGRTSDVYRVTSGSLIHVDRLTPKTKYLLSVVNEKDNGKYFQKVVETSGYGIKLEKKYATSSSLGYEISIEEGAIIDNAKLTLKKFDETLGEYVPVTVEYTNSEQTLVSEEKMYYMSEFKEKGPGVYEVEFDKLDSNTIYTAVLDEFSFASTNYKDIYYISLTSMTLKKTPDFPKMNVVKNVGSSFELTLENVQDDDNAIISYTYEIYEKGADGDTDVRAINPIKKTNSSPITVDVGDGVNELKNNRNYYYRVIIEYFDNEKYIEYVHPKDSIIFVMGDDPYVTIDIIEDEVTHDYMESMIYIKDGACVLSMDGRTCSGESTIRVEMYPLYPVMGDGGNTSVGDKVFDEIVDFTLMSDEDRYDMYYHLKVGDLTPGTTYIINVSAVFNNSVTLERQDLLHTDASQRTVSTKDLAKFKVNWAYYQGTTDYVINSGVGLSTENIDSAAMTPDESLDAINVVYIRLYQGNKTTNLNVVEPLRTYKIYKTDGFNFKDKLYGLNEDGENKVYPINSLDTFRLDMETLKALNGGELNQYYVLTMEAYMSNGYKINLSNSVFLYKVSPTLFLSDVFDPTLELVSIENNNMFSNLTDSGTVVGYTAHALFDRNTLVNVNNITPLKMNFYVYDALTKTRVKFYVKQDKEFVLVDSISRDLGDDNYVDQDIYMYYGTSYETVDDIMRRGNNYYVGYDIDCIAGNEEFTYPEYIEDEEVDLKDVVPYGVYKKGAPNPVKETPKIEMYTSTSESNSVTYKYKIIDADNAIYKKPSDENYSFYYTINGGSERALPLNKLDEYDYNVFEGTLTISGLVPGDSYSLYYKKNSIRTGAVTSDIVNFIDGYGVGPRYFDGVYNSGNYNFKYKITSDEKKDNKVVVEILANDNFLERILGYKLEFIPQNVSGKKTYSVDKYELLPCSGDSSGEVARCLSVDYTDLNKAGLLGVDIKLRVTAMYDTGHTGYDYAVGKDYPYMIMQNYGNEEGPGQYLSLVQSSKGKISFVAWNEEEHGGKPKGYYEYTLRNGYLNYTAVHLGNYTDGININLKATDYSYKTGYIVPKMVAAEEMGCTGNLCNGFRFDTITPMVDVSQHALLVNGVALGLTLSGVDINSLCNSTKCSGGGYGLYVETWKDDNSGDLNTTVRPSAFVQIDLENPTKKHVIAVDGLEYNTKYYFRVYTYMKDSSTGKPYYRELYSVKHSDASGFRTSSYVYTTGKGSDVLLNYSLDYVTKTSHIADKNHSAALQAMDLKYGDRVLVPNISLIAYDSLNFNFDLVYALYDPNTCGDNSNLPVCDIEAGNYLLKQSIDSVRGTSITTVKDYLKITDYDLEYDKNYYFYIYAKADLYVNGEKQEQYIVINRNSIGKKLRNLYYDKDQAYKPPTVTATREAGYDNKTGEYYIDFVVTVNDVNETLDRGYKIKLTDTTGEIVGRMQLLDDGVYLDVSNYTEYVFDSDSFGDTIRITGLEQNSKYSFVVYGDAYINNYSKDTLPGRENRTVEISKPYNTIYSSTNEYGVAFGNEILYAATKNSIVATFPGGSNFKNTVTELTYTITEYNNESSVVFTDTYKIDEKGKCFEVRSGSEDYVFVINPAGFSISDDISVKQFVVSISVKVIVPGTTNTMTLTNAEVPGFSGIAIYAKEDKK